MVSMDEAKAMPAHADTEVHILHGKYRLVLVGSGGGMHTSGIAWPVRW